eukprot:1512803-Rhodomonas_salina.3
MDSLRRADDDSGDEATETDGLLGQISSRQVAHSACTTHSTDRSARSGEGCAHSSEFVSEADGGAGAGRITTLRVGGICCPAEIPIIQRILNPMPGVEDVVVNVLTKTATVKHQGDEV